MRTTKRKTLEVIGKGETVLTACLNHPRIQCRFFVGRETFCDEMRTLVAEIKEQVALIRAGRIRQAEAQKYRTSRLGRHPGASFWVQQERPPYLPRRLPGYDRNGTGFWQWR